VSASDAPGTNDIVVDSNDWPPRARRRTAPALGLVRLNLAAMIDVVFLLLMYFLMATNFSLGEELFRLQLPQSLGSEAETDPFDLPEQPFLIRVGSTGPGPGDYRIDLEGGFAPPATFDILYQIMNGLQVRDGSTGALLFPDTPIIIQPSKGCRWEHAVNTLNACLRARYTNVQFVEPGTG
jgi:hypothetical protein